MFTGIVQFFYPDIKREDVKKVTLLGLAFLFTIGAYWLLRLLKDAVLYKIAFPVELGWHPGYGREWGSTIKLASPWVVLGVVAIYTKLVDMFEKHILFYVIGSFYTACFTFMSAILYFQEAFGPAYVGATLLAATGVGGYLLVESLGSVVVALFWSFTISSTTTDQAKSSFPFIVALGQIGSIGLSGFMLLGLPTWTLYLISSSFLVGLMLTIKYLVATIPANQMQSTSTGKEDKKKKPDFFGGIKLLLTKPYLMGILVVSTFYEIAGTIVDYSMKSQASEILNKLDFNWFLGIFGVSVNGLAFVMALLGTGTIMKKFGIRVCLLVYPISFAICLLALYGYYFHAPAPMHLLWATFAVMLIVKAASYAVNNPVKDMMYIPTGKDAKFKTKGFIDMAGNRTAKGTGALINTNLNVAGNYAASLQNLMLYGSLIGLGIIGVWMLAAIYVGKKNTQLVKSGEIIE